MIPYNIFHLNKFLVCVLFTYYSFVLKIYCCIQLGGLENRNYDELRRYDKETTSMFGAD